MRKKIAFIALAIVPVVLAAVFLCSLLLFIFNQSSNEKTIISQSYQYQEFDFTNKKTTFGTSKLSKHISDENFISYKNQASGHLIVLSNFASSKYECSGTCFCNDEELSVRRTAGSSVLSRGLYLLVSAITSTMAIRIAQEAFEEGCRQQFSDQCQPTQIFSKTQHCEEYFPEKGPGKSNKYKTRKDYVEPMKYGNVKSADLPDADLTRIRENKDDRYVCSGFCMPHPTEKRDLVFQEFLRKRKTTTKPSRIGKCKNLRLQNVEVVWDAPLMPGGKSKMNDKRFIHDWSDEYGGNKQSRKDTIWSSEFFKMSIIDKEAEVIFLKKFLHPFCVKASTVKFLDTEKKGMVWNSGHACVGGETSIPEMAELESFFQTEKPLFFDQTIFNVQCRANPKRND